MPPMICGYCMSLSKDPQREMCDHFIMNDNFAAPVPHRDPSPALLSESLLSTSEQLSSASGQREVTKLRQTLLVLSHKQNHLQRKLNAFRGQQIEIADREFWNFDASQALLQVSNSIGGIPYSKSSGIMKTGFISKAGKGKEKESEDDTPTSSSFVMPMFPEGEGMIQIL
jgi:hypothetical protein